MIERWLDRFSPQQFIVLCLVAGLVSCALFSWLVYVALTRGGKAGAAVVVLVFVGSTVGLIILLREVRNAR